MNNGNLKLYLNRTVLSIAVEEIYTQEITGEDSNQRILQYARDLGIKDYTNDDLSWCALFANWVLFKAAARYLKTLSARTMGHLPFHIHEDDMIAGDVVILWRESIQSWQGHTGIFVNRNGNNIRLISGNQNNMVKISECPKDRILYVRRPILPEDSLLELKHCLTCGTDYFGCRCQWTNL